MICSSPGIGLVPYPVSLAIYFKRIGHEIHAITSSDREYERGLHQALKEASIPIHKVGFIDYSGFRAWSPFNHELQYVLKSIEPNVIHFWGPRFAYQGRSLPRQNIKPIRVAMIGSMGHTMKLQFPIRFAAYCANRFLDGVLALCKADAMRLLKSGINPQKLGIMHFPVACDKNISLANAAIEKGRDKVLNDFKLPLGKKLLGCFAHFHPHKGHALLIKAFEGLASKFPEWDLVLAGSGVTMEECKQLAKKIPNRIHFLGKLPHDQAMFLMPALDAMVHPSRIETYGFSMIEPLLFGLPMVMTRTGIAHEIEKSGTASIVEPNDQQALSQALYYLFSRYPESLERASAGPLFVRRNFDVPVIGEKLIGYYSDLLSKVN